MSQPLAVALHNTRRIQDGAPWDDLADTAGWLATVGLEPLDLDLRALRASVAELLHARIDGRRPAGPAVAAVNAAAAAAPRAVQLVGADPAAARAETVAPGARPEAVVRAALATSAIELLAGPGALRACGAPGCVLLFAGGSPRRAWCSDACGNRARQARFYARHRRGEAAGG